MKFARNLRNDRLEQFTGRVRRRNLQPRPRFSSDRRSGGRGNRAVKYTATTNNAAPRLRSPATRKDARLRPEPNPTRNWLPALFRSEHVNIYITIYVRVRVDFTSGNARTLPRRVGVTKRDLVEKRLRFVHIF